VTELSCVCGGVVVKGDCSPCGDPDGGSPDGDGGACQCMQQVVATPCP
jgi:hypothetical protein